MPGWVTWNQRDETRFNAAVIGPLWTRREGDKCRVRMYPETKHTNVQDMIHGAVTLALIDISIFAAMHTLSSGEPGLAVTLELSNQFLGPGKPAMPLDAVVEQLRETRRMIFVRGIVEQEDHLVASFSGIIRKPSRQ